MGNFSLANAGNIRGTSLSAVAFGDLDNDNDPDMILMGFDGVHRIPIGRLYFNTPNLIGVSEYLVDESTPGILFPNPTNGTFNISGEGGDQVVQVRIYDPSGRLVQSEETTSLPNNSIRITQPPGLYFVRVSTKSGKYLIAKLIKN